MSDLVELSNEVKSDWPTAVMKKRVSGIFIEKRFVSHFRTKLGFKYELLEKHDHAPNGHRLHLSLTDKLQHSYLYNFFF